MPSVSGGVPTFDVSLTIRETVHTNANAGTNVRFTGEASHFDREWARCGRRSSSSICTSVPFELLDRTGERLVLESRHNVAFGSTKVPRLVGRRQ